MTDADFDVAQAFFRTGLDLLEQRETSRAIESLDRARTLCAALELEQDAALCLRWIGLAHLRAENPAAAAAAFIDAVALLDDGGESELLTDCAYFAASALDTLDRTGESIPYLRRAIRGHRALGDLVGEAECTSELALALADAEQLRSACRTMREASVKFIAAEQLSDAADCLHAAGDMAMADADVPAARELYAAAVESYRRAERATGEASTESIADCEEALAEIFAEEGRFDEAIEAFGAAATGLRGLGEHLRAGDCHRRIGMLMLKSGRIASATDEFGIATDEFAESGEFGIAAEMALVHGSMAQNLDRYDQARAAFERARACHVATGDAIQIARCDMELATLRLSRGDFDAAEATLRQCGAVFAAADERQLFAQSLHHLGSAALQRGELATALELATATVPLAEQGEDPEFHAGCLVEVAAVLLSMNEFDRAATYATQARLMFEHLGSWPMAAACRATEGACLLGLGRYDESEQALTEALTAQRSFGTVAHQAATEQHLGLLYTNTGRPDRAVEAFQHSIALFTELGRTADIAQARANLAGVHMKQANFADAAAVLRLAAADLERIGLSHRAATCRQNLGVAILMQGHTAEGLALLESSLRHFESDPAHRANTAACHRNIGIAHRARDRHDLALAHLARARAISLELGALLDVALIDILVAETGIMRPDGSLRTALDLALPAMLYLESRRLQLSDASGRVGTAALYSALQSVLFDWVHRLRDPALMAELIEVSLNAGVHGGPPPDSTTTDLALLIGEITPAPASPDRTQRHDGVAAVRPSDALGALIRGATLPIHPAPLLRMPDGAIALRRQLRAADERYGGVERPPDVRAW